MPMESLPYKTALINWKGWAWVFPFAGLALLIPFVPLPLPFHAPQDRVLRIEASSFQFMPGEIQINPGDRVTVELVSTDVVHGFSLDGYGCDRNLHRGSGWGFPFSLFGGMRQSASLYDW